MVRDQKGWIRGLGTFLLVLIPSWTLAFLYEFQSQTRHADLERAEFVVRSDLRHTRILQKVDQLKAVLRASKALFAASERVTEQDFAGFSSTILGDRAVARWVDSKTDEQFAWVGAHADRELANEPFDILRPSGIRGQPPNLVLSETARSATGLQIGFVSYTLPIGQLFLDDLEPLISERIVVCDVAENTVASYVKSASGTVELTTEKPARAKSRNFELQNVGDVGLYYSAELQGRPMASPSIALLLLLGLGLITALYARAIVTESGRDAVQVKRRTDELSQFAYRTSHDLRAPLASASGLCRATLEDWRDGDTQCVEPNLERIAAQVRRLELLVVDILELARADLKEHDRVPVSLVDLCNETRDGLVEAYPDTPVELSFEVRPPDAFAMVTPARIRQILSNLASNGIKYHSPKVEKPFVRIELALDRGLRITVSDNGLGIPIEMQPKLFRMFERFHPSTSESGSGLGMSIVKKHVDQLQGKIRVHSSEQGTRIEIEVPAESVK